MLHMGDAFPNSAEQRQNGEDGRLRSCYVVCVDYGAGGPLPQSGALRAGVASLHVAVLIRAGSEGEKRGFGPAFAASDEISFPLIPL
jgi:hypothetical protein